MNKGAFLYLIYWDDTLVGMFSVLNHPNGAMKYAFRVHRVVILPDFQGLGIGTKVIDFFGQYFLNRGDKLFLKTTHIRFGRHCSNSLEWKVTAENNVRKDGDSGGQRKKFRNTKYGSEYRQAYSFEYVGSDYCTKEHQPIICMGDCSFDRAIFRVQQILDGSKCPIIITGIANQNEINVWERVAKYLHIRTEILFLKANGEFKLVQKHFIDKFDCILCGESAVGMLKPYEEHIGNKYIAI